METQWPPPPPPSLPPELIFMSKSLQFSEEYWPPPHRGGKKIDALNTEHGNCYEKSKNCVLWVHIKGTPKQTLVARKASQRKVISRFRPERWMRVGWLHGAGEAKMLRGLRKFCLNYSWKAHLVNLDGVGQLTSGFWNLNFSSLSDTSAWAQVMLRSLQFQRNVGKWENLVD